MDIIGPERILLNIPQQTAIVGSCKNARIPITVTLRAEQRVTRSIKANHNVTIPPHTHMMIPIQQHELPDDRDLLFEPVDTSDGLAIHAHVVDCYMATVQARNDSELPVTLQKDTLLGTVVEYEVDGCLRAHPDIALLAATSNIPKKNLIREVFAAAAETTIEESATAKTPETRLDKGVTIYGSEDPADFKAIVDEFPDLWTDNGSAVNVPEDQWMEIPLLENWRDLYNPRQAKSLSTWSERPSRGG